MFRMRTLMMMMVLLVANAQTMLAQDGGDDNIATFRTWAMTPPMGWNSWDCYYSSVTEKEVLQNAQYIVDNDLVRHGWEYVVIDIRWYCNHPSLGGGWYNQRGDQEYVIDEYGRYLPSPTRFPSCMVDGKNMGFKALADKIHSMGLKFGIHIMRGVPKSVVGSSYKLKGSESTPWSQVYNGTTPPCAWLQDNLLVRNNKAGQLYYNSIMDLYAEWGVDFLKIDARPDFGLATVENRIGDSVGFLKDLALFYAYNFMGLVVHAKDNRATLAIGKSYNSLDKLDTLFRNISLELKHL